MEERVVASLAWLHKAYQALNRPSGEDGSQISWSGIPEPGSNWGGQPLKGGHNAPDLTNSGESHRRGAQIPQASRHSEGQS